MWDLFVSVPDHCLSFYSTPEGLNEYILGRQAVQSGGRNGSNRLNDRQYT